MRNHYEILEEIMAILATKGLNEEKRTLESEISASSTGSELCLRSGSTLLRLQKTSERVHSQLGQLIREFISYCHKNGLYPRSN
jgi:hypothetical protein